MCRQLPYICKCTASKGLIELLIILRLQDGGTIGDKKQLYYENITSFFNMSEMKIITAFEDEGVWRRCL